MIKNTDPARKKTGRNKNNTGTVKTLCIIIAAVLLLPLFACSGDNGTTPAPGNTMDPAITPVPHSDPENGSRETEAEFNYTSFGTGAKAELSGSVLKITGPGEYVLSGKLGNGRILVNAGKNDEVKLVLNNVSITCSNEAPITALNADKVTVRSEKGAYNVIRDTRANENEQHDAAIYAECDLKLTGEGTLIVSSDKLGGVRTKDDLTVKGVQLKVNAAGSALRGSDSVTVESGSLLLISGKHCIKTNNSKVSSKGNQKGDIGIFGGTLELYSAGTAIDSAHNVELFASAKCSVNIYTDAYAGNAGTGAMGIRANNDISISGGTVNIFAGGDGIHADAGEKLENGAVSTGSVTVAKGDVTITCGDDAVHAEGVLTINGGSVNIPESHEGFEANVININGGTTVIVGSDDGMNACKGAKDPVISITGGTLDVTAPSGKSDAIDSNGDLVMTGGFVIVRCGASGAATSVDVKGTVSVTGGTMVAVGRIADVPKSGSVNTVVSKAAQLTAGEYGVKNANGETLFTFPVDGAYSSLWIASDMLQLNGTYSLANGSGASALEWTQSSACVDDR